MTLSRRDTIILAVLVNAAFLSILFLLASRGDPQDNLRPHEQFTHNGVNDSATFEEVELNEESNNAASSGSTKNPFITSPLLSQKESLFNEPSPQAKEPVQDDVIIASSEPLNHSLSPVWEEEAYREVTVKKGDFLEKIARTNHTTVNEIKRINRLVDDRIDIGQVLYVPKQTSIRSDSQSQPQPQRETSQAEYYTVKAGDSPWTIARKNHVKLEELLKINELDEETARNLRPGDKIRVR